MTELVEEPRTEVVELSTGCLFAAGFDSIERELLTLRRRLARNRARATDADDVRACILALAELRAGYRAALRVRLEGFERPLDPLDVALIQAEELVADRLPLRTIPIEMREALRERREADYAVVLYTLAGSGGDSSATD
jgi:hypothetical protein